MPHGIVLVRSFVPADGIPPRAPSVTAAIAARALARITAANPLVHDWLVGAATVMNYTQHVLPSIANEAETRRVISLVSGLDNPDLPRHKGLYNSNCRDSVTLAMAPSDPATTLSNRSFATGSIRRLLLPISHVNRGERRRCPGCHKESTCESSRDEPLRSVDELGTTCWGVRAFPRHVRACGTALWSRSGSCLPGWLACRAEKMCAT